MSIPLTHIKGIEFDVQRELLLGKGAKLFLLTAAREELVRVESGWYAEFNGPLGSPVFKVAREDDAFNSIVADASLLVVTGSNRAALNNQLHAINRDTTIPAGVEPVWKIAASATGKRHTVSG